MYAIASFFVRRGDRFGDGAGSVPDNQERLRYVLAGANFGDGAESVRVQFDVEGLLMSDKFLDGCHDDRFKFPLEP